MVARRPPGAVHDRRPHWTYTVGLPAARATETAALTDVFIVVTTALIMACWRAMFATIELLAVRICSLFCAAIVDICAVDVDSIVLIATELAVLMVSSWAPTAACMPAIDPTKPSIRAVCEPMRVRVALKAASRASIWAVAAQSAVVYTSSKVQGDHKRDGFVW